jgi:integrase
LTYEQYSQHVRLYLAPKRNDGTHRPLPALGTIRLPKLRPSQVQAFLNRQLKKKLSPRTVQLSLVILRRALDQAVRWNLAARNVAKLVDPPRAKRPPFKVLTPEQTQQFLRAAVGHPLESLFIVALATGLREGELFGLKWSDINFDDKTLTVNRTVHRVSERYSGQPSQMVFAEPKTDRSRRKIFLPEIALAALKGQRKRQAEARLAAGKEWTDRGLIFTTRNGGPLEANNTIRRFHAVLEDAKLPAIRFHDLRHGAASLLLSRGVHPRAVMELLGHSKIGVTMDTYSHVMAPMMRDVADQMDKALGA